MTLTSLVVLLALLGIVWAAGAGAMLLSRNKQVPFLVLMAMLWGAVVMHHCIRLAA